MPASASGLEWPRPGGLPPLAAAAVLALLAVGGAGSARAQALDVQQLLLLACLAPPPGTGLADRCAESAGGDLSPDSEASLTPSQFLSVHALAIARGRARTREILQGLEDRRDAARAAARSARAAGAAGSGAPVPAAPRFGAFASGRGIWLDRSAGVQERGFDGTSHGALLGGDWRPFPGALLGGLVGYDRADSEYDPDRPLGAFPPVASRSGALDSNTFTLGVFGSYPLTHAIYVDASFEYGFSDYEIERESVFQDAARTTSTRVQTRARPDGQEITASARLGYELERGQLTFGPYGFASWVRSDLESWVESDRSASGMAMQGEGTARDSLISVVGARWSFEVATPVGPLVPQGRIEWEHEFLQFDRNQTTGYALDPSGSQLTLTADAPDRSHFMLGGGLLLALPGGWVPFLDYEGLVGEPELSQHRLTFGLRAAL